MAYCEPLNEALETVTRQSIAQLTAQRSQLKHPHLESAYFEEFVPLLNAGGVGVRHYRQGFGITDYFGPSPALEAGLRFYIESLLGHAQSRGLQPVMKFTRALGRAHWLRHAFPAARQILLLRPPMEQFISGWLLARRTGNRTFLMIPLFLASRPEQGPLCELCQRFAIPRFPSENRFAECTGEYAALSDSLAPEVLFAAFLGVFISSYAVSAPHADLIIHSDRLAADIRAREHAEQSLRALSGVDIDLSGVASIRHPANPLADEPSLDRATEIVCAMFRPSFPAAVEETLLMMKSAPTS